MLVIWFVILKTSVHVHELVSGIGESLLNPYSKNNNNYKVTFAISSSLTAEK